VGRSADLGACATNPPSSGTFILMWSYGDLRSNDEFIPIVLRPPLKLALEDVPPEGLPADGYPPRHIPGCVHRLDVDTPQGGRCAPRAPPRWSERWLQAAARDTCTADLSSLRWYHDDDGDAAVVCYSLLRASLPRPDSSINHQVCVRTTSRLRAASLLPIR